MSSGRKERGFTPFRRYAVHGFAPFRRYAVHGFTPFRRYGVHGFTPFRRYAVHGFTLIELMVVIVIIGLAAAAVVLTMPDGGSGLAREAERFAARAKAARDTAIVESRATAVAIGPGGYDVVRRGGRAHYDWDEATGVTVAGGRDGGLRFDPTGLADPARVVLSRGERHVAIDIGGGGDVQVRR